MGSFNTSCFVSRQTIAPGDACMVIPIMQKSGYNPVALSYKGVELVNQYGVTSSTCYPTRFWVPVGSFFEAVYDDYGRVNLSDTPTNRFKLLDFIRQALEKTPVVSQGENTVHDVPYDLVTFMTDKAPELLAYLTARGKNAAELQADLFFQQGVACWDYIYDVAQEQRMFWTNYLGVLRPMNFAIMHRASFDTLVSITSGWTGWDGVSYEMRPYLDAALDLAKAAIARETNTFEQVHFGFAHLTERIRRVGGNEGSAYPAEHLALDAVGHAYVNGGLTGDQLFEYLKPWMEIRWACAALGNLNLHFEPVVYASQDYDNEIGQEYAKFVADVSRKVTVGRIEGMYGPFKKFGVTISTKDVLPIMVDAAMEYDGRIEIGAVEVDYGFLEGHWYVNLNSTLTFESLAEMLDEMTDDRIVLGTLREIPA